MGIFVKGSVAAAIVYCTMASASFAADHGPITLWFDATPSDVSDKLANLCADRNAAVVEQDDRHVLCQKDVSGLRGAFTQALLGNSHSTPPTLNIRFAILKDRGASRVQASQWIELQMAMGQVRRTELDGGKDRHNMISLLSSIGGRETYADALAADNSSESGDIPRNETTALPKPGSWTTKVGGLKLGVVLNDEHIVTVSIRSIFKAKTADVEDKMRAAVKLTTGCTMVSANWLGSDLVGHLSCG